MKASAIKTFVALLASVALLSGCSGPQDNSASSNNNAQQASDNSNQQAQAQNEAPSPTTETPLKVQPIPPPTPPTNANTKTAAAPTASGRQPKLVAPEKKLDFGKQPQDKTIVRAIHIKNAGQAALNIESVTPS